MLCHAVECCVVLRKRRKKYKTQINMAYKSKSAISK